MDACIVDFDVVIAPQIPGDPDRPQMIFLTQVDTLVDNLFRFLVGWIYRRRRSINETGCSVSTPLRQIWLNGQGRNLAHHSPRRGSDDETEIRSAETDGGHV